MMFKNMLILSVFLFSHDCYAMESWDGKSSDAVAELSRDSSILTKEARADGQPDLADLIALEQGFVPVDDEEQGVSEFIQSIRDRIPALNLLSDATLKALIKFQKNPEIVAQLKEQLLGIPLAKRGVHGPQGSDSTNFSVQLLSLLTKQMDESNSIQKRRLEEHKKIAEQALEESRKANELAGQANELAVQTSDSAALDSVKNTQIQKKQFWITTAVALIGLVVTGALSITALVSTYTMGNNSTGH